MLRHLRVGPEHVGKLLRDEELEVAVGQHLELQVLEQQRRVLAPQVSVKHVH